MHEQACNDERTSGIANVTMKADRVYIEEFEEGLAVVVTDITRLVINHHRDHYERLPIANDLLIRPDDILASEELAIVLVQIKIGVIIGLKFSMNVLRFIETLIVDQRPLSQMRQWLCSEFPASSVPKQRWRCLANKRVFLHPSWNSC